MAPMLPSLIDLIVSSCGELPLADPLSREDVITDALCLILRRNRRVRDFPFLVYTQLVELDPAVGEEEGRLDIVFQPLVPDESIYFCLECKRLNVVRAGVRRSYANEYVTLGMMRFVTGKYSRGVQHGGMLGYVYDGDIIRAIRSVEKVIRARCSQLGMSKDAVFAKSEIRAGDARIRMTRHRRRHAPVMFNIHHVFHAMALLQ